MAKKNVSIQEISNDNNKYCKEYSHEYLKSAPVLIEVSEHGRGDG